MTNASHDDHGRFDRPEALVLRDRAMLAMRLQGASLAEIADRFGVSIATASRAVKRAIAESVPARAVEELRSEQLMRLERLWAALWPRIEAGSARHAEVGLRVLERQARLMGLDAPEVRTIEVVTKDAVMRAIEDLERQILDLGGDLPELPPGDDA